MNERLAGVEGGGWKVGGEACDVDNVGTSERVRRVEKKS